MQLFYTFVENINIMSTAIISAEIDAEYLPTFKVLLKQFKAKSIKIEEKKTYSDELAKKITQARKERERGETIKISSENLWKIVK